jgi:ankyrin repeat protein
MFSQDGDEASHGRVLQVMSVLLSTDGVEVNAEDLRGQLTPLAYAATAANKEAVLLLIEHGADPDVSMDDQKVRDIIAESIPGFDFDAVVTRVRQRPVKQRLFNCVETDDVNGLRRLSFLAQKGEIEWNCNNGSMTLLQLACTHGNERAVRFLLGQHSIDPNLTTASEQRTPALIVAHHGYIGVLKELVKHGRTDLTVVEATTGKTVLHEVFVRDSAKRESAKTSYGGCARFLLGEADSGSNARVLAQVVRVINYQELLDGNTALHYATMQADQDLIKLMLKRGANMGVKNWKGKTSVQSILPTTLNEFLDDECIEGNGTITDEQFTITFKYDFLAPPILNAAMASSGSAVSPTDIEDSEEKAQEERALPETEALWYLSTASKQHRSLLKHPVIASFLWLKWQRIRTFYYMNLLLYVAFVILLTTFIFLRFGGRSIQPVEPVADVGIGKDSSVIEFNGAHRDALNVLAGFITLLLVLLAIREIFQMLVSFKRYFFSVENLMELTVIVLSFIILFGGDDDEALLMRRHLAAIVILFTWTETLVLVGRHPKLSANITMLTTVVSTFFFFLLWYGIIIVAFGIAFYIMFHEDHAGGTPKEDYPFFDGVWISLLKTSAMFVGELEFSDIPFTSNVVSYLIFLAFIFLITIVLANLLNGLAVSTRMLKPTLCYKIIRLHSYSSSKTFVSIS